jgi:lipopolysaccharide/colanic/teichoic acid biosynthesis glycosyltransferase
MVYRQRRVGRGGREFDLLKFRSMRLSAPQGGFSPAAGSAPGGVEGDDRRTTVGRWIRNTSLDELPQLLNVVRGEMSLVGPRPERPEFAGRFAADVAGYADRHRVKPGITGWAQVNGLRGQTSIADRVEWDNYYIDNWSIRLELRTIALTIAAMMSFSEDRKPSTGPAAEPVLVPAPPPPVAGPTGPPEPPSPEAPKPLHPEPRPPLVVLDTTSSAEAATHWFCGYCGTPADGKTPSPVSRVCPRCEQGLLLEAPAEAAPRREDAFLIVDSNLRVQAVSRRAEQILGVSETEATNLPVTELIGDAEAERDHVESFAAALTRTAVSDETGGSAFVRPRESFGIRMRARITHCGPPRAALIVLEAPDTAPRLRLVQAERHAQADEAGR